MEDKRRIERTVQQSVLDRLIDEDPRTGTDSPVGWDASVDSLRQAVLRDLEELLNTRRIPEPAPDRYPETQRSVYHFGIPDVSSLSGDSDAVRRRLLRQIEESVQRFEPRLAGVRVSHVEEENGVRQLRYVIEGLLRVEPDPERVAFDTVLEISSGTFRVSGGRRA